MAAAGDARICLNASMAGLIPIEMDPLFAATKHAVVGLGRSIAGPLSAQGVRVTLLCAMVPDSPNVPDSIRPVLEQAFGPLLEPRRVAQAALDLLEFGASGEIRVVTPERYSRARIRIEFEDVEPAAAYDE
jgi:short-subunit dehydrogenase